MIDVQPENWLGELLPSEVALAPEASQPIMKVYSELDLAMESKRHGSPLARAGLRSHHLVLNRFALLSPNWPVLSQKSPKVPFDQRKAWRLFWPANPRDGIQEFLRANGEFTVKVALIDSNAPIARSAGAGKVDREITTQVKAARAERATVRTRASPSRRSQEPSLECSIGGAEKRKFIVIVMGSSPEFCPVAEDYSDRCPAFTGTMNGDAVAAHCILEQAGVCCRLGWQFHELQQTLTTKIRHPAHGPLETIRSHPEARVGCLAGRSKGAD